MKNFPLWLLPLATIACAQIQKESLQSSGSTNTQAVGATAFPDVYVADTVTAAPGNTGSGFYDQSKAINGVRGSGNSGGSLDVFSLDNSGASAFLTLSWAGKKIKNGSGADFVVYENAFYASGNPAQRFMDLMFVEVSSDNVNYCGFAPDYTATTETVYSNNPANWQRFAGRNPVLYNVDSNNLAAAQLFQDNDANGEPDLGGGDPFDLDNLSADNTYSTGCNTTVRDDLKTNGFRYLRLTPAVRRNNPDTGAAFVADSASFGPDIDGVVARYVQ